jgi:hypothetical protein
MLNVLKPALAAVAMIALAAGAARAETPAATPEACLKVAFDIAQAAEGKKLTTETLDKIEAMLTKMETHCDAKQFTEAAAVAGDLKTIISKE